MVLDEEFPPDLRVEREALSLIHSGHHVDLLCYTRTNKKTTEQYKGISIYRVPISRLKYKFKALSLSFPLYFNFWKKKLEKQVRKEKYDVIHFHDLPLAKPCIEIAKKYSIPVIGDYHENRPEIMKMYHHVTTFPGKLLISTSKWEYFQKEYSPKLDQLILVTREAKDYYHSNFNILNDKINVVANYPVLSDILESKIDGGIIQRYQKKFMILYFGDTGTRRGTLTLIEAAFQLRNEHEYHFVLIGTSREQKQLTKKVKELGLSNIELLGYVPFQKAVSYIAASKAGVCPFLRNIHHDTTYANKLFQYMALGKPPIVSDCPSQVNVIKESHAGLIFKAGNVNELVDRISALKKDKKLYDSLSDNARTSVREKYHYKTAERNLLEAYKKIENEN
ncbi:MAG: glycosyltransferase family 4 protein [Bacteroidota bacterium]|nr:glycosyltransferase family 4 protein [Bacteroidota bacterium]